MAFPEVTDQQRADLEYVTSLMVEDVPFQLDLSDERQYRHAVAMHTLGGQTPERNPGLHKALAQSRDLYRANGMPLAAAEADEDGFQSGGVITMIAPRESNVAGSEGFVSLLGGAATLTSVMVVYDGQNNWLASGNAVSYNDGAYLPVETAAQGARPAAPLMTSYLQYTYQQQVGGPVNVFTVQQRRAAGVTADPTVTQPVQKPAHAGNPYIRIGLGRGNGDTSDVDYWFWQGTSNTTYAVPLVGSVQFTSNMASPLVPNQNLFIYGKLARAAGSGGGYYNIPPDSLTNFYNNCQASTPNTLAWNLPAGTSPSNSNPLIFGSIPWTSEVATYLFIQFQVLLQGTPIPAVAVIQSSDTPDNDPLDGVTNIKPLQFVYHCLAQGTLITLADGSTLPVESLTTGHVVRTGEGQTLPVTSTWVAPHQGPVVRLETDAGHTLVMSHNHVVMTPQGPQMAGDLAEGGQVHVSGGTATITTARTEDFDGLLCNASLSAPNQPADATRNTMFANGVQVCDFEVQTQHGRDRRADPDVVRASIDPVFLPDYENYLAEQREKAGAA